MEVLLEMIFSAGHGPCVLFVMLFYCYYSIVFIVVLLLLFYCLYCCSIVIILLSLLFILFSLRLIDFSHVY